MATFGIPLNYPSLPAGSHKLPLCDRRTYFLGSNSHKSAHDRSDSEYGKRRSGGTTTPPMCDV